MSRAQHLALALIAFVPQLLSQPGVVDSDTKTYLYQDPATFLRQSATMWDPTSGLGTVTHQQLGYLFPMGPFYLVLHALAVPTWVAERLWVGTILFGAGAGVLYLCRTVGLRGPGRMVAALAFTLSPYFLQYVGRISVILLPWAGLPWLVAFTARALRRGGWRYPALFALVVFTVGGINASSLIYVGVAPVLWLPYAVLVARESTWREAWGAAWRIGMLCLLVSLWWIVGLEIEGADGVNVLKYTETVPAVSSTSLASEVLRGLGYWYFYGGDTYGQWVSTAVQLTQSLVVLAFGFLVPALSYASAVMIRWRHRTYFVLLILVGMVFAVGAHPFLSPTAVGRVLKSFFTTSTAGLALRSTDRASPLVMLGLAVLLGAGITALSRRARWIGLAGAGLTVVVIGVANPAVWDGATVADHFTQPATLPGYVTSAANALNHESPGTRVLAVPGNNFAQYRWGDTIDPVWPGLLDANRPFVTHQQLILGSLPTGDLLYALDNPLQQGTANPAALAPLAGLMSAGDVLVQNDLGYERYDTPQPLNFWQTMVPTPPGLGAPVGYGTPRPNVSLIPMVNEKTLSTPPDTTVPSPVEIFPVTSPRPVVRAESAGSGLVVDGNGQGLAAAAGAGLLSGDPSVVYAGTLDTNRAVAATVLGTSPTLVVTDTNRKQTFRWNVITDAAGYTQTATEAQPRNDPSNAPLNLFPGAPTSSQSTTVYDGIASVTASSYGDPVTYLPEDRPAGAVDGSTDTAWQTAAYDVPEGQWWQLGLQTPVTTGQVTLVQPQDTGSDRSITRITLSFDGGNPVQATLGPASLRPGGQVVSFPGRTFRTLRITIDDTTLGNDQTDFGSGPVGFAEVELGGVRAQESVSMPTDLLQAAGTGSLNDRLALLMTREKVAPYPPRTDPETAISREFSLPTARSFTLSGTGSISALIPDDAIDRLVGRPGSDGSGVVAYSKGRLPGVLTAGAQAALDGNPATAWSPGFGGPAQENSWIEVNLPRVVSFDHLDLQIVADGLHSVPTSLRVGTENGSVDVPLPPIADGRRQGGTVSVPVSFPAVTGKDLRITVTGVRLERTVNYFSQKPLALPLAIAELGIPGVSEPAPPAQIPSPCRSDLLTIDGRVVWLEVVGSSADALAGHPLTVQLCGDDTAGLTLGPGLHTLVATPAHDPSFPTGGPGINLDTLVLDSAPGGMPGTDTPGHPLSPLSPLPGARAPKVTVLSLGSTSARLRVGGVTKTTAPFWIVLGESQNNGWVAGIDGGPGLGGPTLVDGFANGWLVTPATLGASGRTGSFEVTVRWTPQGHAELAIGISLVGVLGCLALAVVPPELLRRRRGRHLPVGPVHLAIEADSFPALSSPLVVGGQALSWPRMLALAGACALVAGSVTTLPGGLAVGLAVVTVLALPRSRWLLTLGGLGLLVSVLVFMVVFQASRHVPAGGLWPVRFEQAGSLTWLALAFLGADAVVEIARRARPTWRYEPPWDRTVPPAPLAPPGTASSPTPAPAMPPPAPGRSMPPAPPPRAPEPPTGAPAAPPPARFPAPERLRSGWSDLPDLLDGILGHGPDPAQPPPPEGE